MLFHCAKVKPDFNLRNLFLGYKPIRVSLLIIGLIPLWMVSLDCQADQLLATGAHTMQDSKSGTAQTEFEIEPQPLATALIEFGQQAGRSVLLQHALRNIQTKGLHGAYEPTAGLHILLAETGLEFKETDSGIIVSQPVAKILPVAASKPEPRSLLGRIGTILTAVLIGSPVIAIAEEAGDSSSKIIEEIVVTAQKREGALRKTPIAITAVTADMIGKLDISDINSLEKLAPSLTYNHAAAGLQLYIRGVGQDAPTIGSSPGVAVYVDGIYHGHQFANAATALDADRFEVVRGPQGTLYGRNSTGGNINIHSAKPHFDKELKISATAGSDKLRKFSLTGNLPIKSDVVAIRGTIMSHDRDGYRKNLVDGSDLDEVNTFAANMSLLFTPSSDFEMVLRADYQKDKGGPRPLVYAELVPGSGLSPLVFGAQSVGRSDTDVYHDFEDFEETELKGISATLTWQLGSTTLRSVTSVRDSKRTGQVDSDGTDLAFVVGFNHVETTEISQEFNLLGSAMEGKLDWIVGVNYYKDDASAEYLFDLPFFAFLLPPLPPLPNLNGVVTTIPFIHSKLDDDLESVGVFAQGTYSLSDETRLTLGYRYTRDEKDVQISSFSNITPPSAHCIDSAGSKKWTPSTFKIGVDHDLSDENMVYASFSRGFKAGGFNVTSCGGSPYDEEVLNAYELGYKGSFMDGQLTLFSSVYYYDYSDMQVRRFVELRVEFDNAAEAEIYGFESEFVFQPSSNWRIDGGFNWQSAEYKKGMLDDSMVGGILEVDISGNQLLRAPDLKANMGVQFTHWLNSGASLEARYDASYSDSYYVDAHENSFARIDSRTVQNFRVTWSNADRSTFIQLFVNNLGNEKHLEWLLNTPSAGGTVGMWAAPRTYGVRFGFSTL